MAYIVYHEVHDYLRRQNVSITSIRELEDILTSFLFLQNLNAQERLAAWEITHSLADYRRPLQGERQHVSRQEGIDRIVRLAKEPRIIGLCGRPAVGKTHLLRELSQKYKLQTIDEFSPERTLLFGYDEEDYENPNMDRALTIRENGDSVVVASARLEGTFDNKFYLDRTWPTRTRNILMQFYLLRRLSVILDYQVKRVIERYNYEFQKTSCDDILDLHR